MHFSIGRRSAVDHNKPGVGNVLQNTSPRVFGLALPSISLDESITQYVSTDSSLPRNHSLVQRREPIAQACEQAKRGVFKKSKSLCPSRRGTCFCVITRHAIVRPKPAAFTVPYESEVAKSYARGLSLPNWPNLAPRNHILLAASYAPLRRWVVLDIAREWTKHLALLKRGDISATRGTSAESTGRSRIA